MTKETDLMTSTTEFSLTSRRSSILKQSRLSQGGSEPLKEMDCNILTQVLMNGAAEEGTGTVVDQENKEKRLSRRVSFANTYQVQEFIRDPETWKDTPNSAAKETEEGVDQQDVKLAMASSDKEAYKPSASLGRLLTGPIQYRQLQTENSSEESGATTACSSPSTLPRKRRRKRRQALDTLAVEEDLHDPDDCRNLDMSMAYSSDGDTTTNRSIYDSNMWLNQSVVTASNETLAGMPCEVPACEKTAHEKTIYFGDDGMVVSHQTCDYVASSSPPPPPSLKLRLKDILMTFKGDLKSEGEASGCSLQRGEEAMVAAPTTTTSNPCDDTEALIVVKSSPSEDSNMIDLTDISQNFSPTRLAVCSTSNPQESVRCPNDAAVAEPSAAEWQGSVDVAPCANVSMSSRELDGSYLEKAGDPDPPAADVEQLHVAPALTANPPEENLGKLECNDVVDREQGNSRLVSDLGGLSSSAVQPVVGSARNPKPHSRTTDHGPQAASLPQLSMIQSLGEPGKDLFLEFASDVNHPPAGASEENAENLRAAPTPSPFPDRNADLRSAAANRGGAAANDVSIPERETASEAVGGGATVVVPGTLLSQETKAVTKETPLDIRPPVDETTTMTTATQDGFDGITEEPHVDERVAVSPGDPLASDGQLSECVTNAAAVRTGEPSSHPPLVVLRPNTNSQKRHAPLPSVLQKLQTIQMVRLHRMKSSASNSNIPMKKCRMSEAKRNELEQPSATLFTPVQFTLNDYVQTVHSNNKRDGSKSVPRTMTEPAQAKAPGTVPVMEPLPTPVSSSGNATDASDAPLHVTLLGCDQTVPSKKKKKNGSKPVPLAVMDALQPKALGILGRDPVTEPLRVLDLSSGKPTNATAPCTSRGGAAVCVAPKRSPEASAAPQDAFKSRRHKKQKVALHVKTPPAHQSANRKRRDRDAESSSCSTEHKKRLVSTCVQWANVLVVEFESALQALTEANEAMPTAEECLELERLNEDIDEKQKRLMALEDELKSLKKQSRAVKCRKQDLERRVGDAKQTVETEKGKQRQEMESARRLLPFVEFVIHEWSKTDIHVSFFSENLHLRLALNDSSAATKECRKVVGVTKWSTLAGNADIFTKFAYDSMWNGLDVVALACDCPTTDDVKQLLQKLSLMLVHARMLAMDLKSICIYYLVTCNGDHVTVEFLDPMTITDFTLTFHIVPGTYPLEPIAMTFKSIHGNMEEQRVLEALAAVTPCPSYLKKMVNKVGALLTTFSEMK